MILAIDWDGTWAADVNLFAAFANLARAAGHMVVIVTNRPKTWPIEKTFAGVGVLYCDGRPKRVVVREWIGDAAPVVWIDDNPSLVDLGHEGMRLIDQAPITPEELYLISKARSLRETGGDVVTTNHGVLMTYDRHRRLSDFELKTLIEKIRRA